MSTFVRPAIYHVLYGPKLVFVQIGCCFFFSFSGVDPYSMMTGHLVHPAPRHRSASMESRPGRLAGDQGVGAALRHTVYHVWTASAGAVGGSHAFAWRYLCPVASKCRPLCDN